ncbi:PilZ domain-containing protein [Altererythrobacter sp.]|uniref:PilZ domain-containing protein n=1 Tax=Altererythrobacter sp. TaxID=1872480 RepID=UPI003D1436DA
MRPDIPQREIFSLDQRRSKRIELASMGQFVLQDGAYDCQVVEISLCGALLLTLAELRVGQDGLLRCDGLDLLCQVVRIEPGFAAVEFVDESGETADVLDRRELSRAENNYQILRFLDP